MPATIKFFQICQEQDYIDELFRTNEGLRRYSFEYIKPRYVPFLDDVSPGFLRTKYGGYEWIEQTGVIYPLLSTTFDAFLLMFTIK